MSDNNTSYPREPNASGEHDAALPSASSLSESVDAAAFHAPVAGDGESPSGMLEQASASPVVDLSVELIEQDGRQVPSDRPSYCFYSPGCVAWAAFWGGPIGGAIVLARNEWKLNRRGRAMALIVASACATIALALALDSVETKYILFASMIQCLGLWFFAVLLQGARFEAHQRRGGTAGSGRVAFGLGIIGGIVAVVLASGVNVAMQESMGTRVAIGRNDEVYFRGGATEYEARRLGEFLRTDGFFDELTPQTALLNREGRTVLVSFFLDDGVWNEPSVVREYERYAESMSRELFQGHPVQILLRNSMSIVKHRCAPKVGVSTANWKRDTSVAETAFDEGRLGDAEEGYRAAIREAESHESLRPQLVAALNRLAICRLVQGEAGDAELHLRRALAMADDAYGENSWEACLAHYWLAHCAWKGGKLVEAESLGRRALAMREGVEGDGHPGAPEIIDLIVSVLIAQELFPAARDMQQRKIALVEGASATSGVAFGEDVRLLAWLNWRLGNYDESSRRFAQALAVLESAAEPESNVLLTCLWQFGIASQALGEFGLANERFRNAIRKLEASAQPDELLLAGFRYALADLLAHEAKYDEAEKLLLQVALPLAPHLEQLRASAPQA